MKKNLPIEVWGDGSVIRDYIRAGDIAEAITKLIAKGCWNEIFNVGSGRGHSINQVLEIIQAQIGSQSKINYAPSRSIDVSRIVLDINKLKAVISFHPIPLEEGITLYLNSLR